MCKNNHNFLKDCTLSMTSGISYPLGVALSCWSSNYNEHNIKNPNFITNRYLIQKRKCNKTLIA